MKAVFKHELNMYFTGVSGYVFGAFILLFAGLYSVAVNIQGRLANFEYVLSNMVFIFIAIIPVLTMRMVAEERRQKTEQLLYSLPLGMTQIVMGKYLAALVMLAIPTGVMSFYPIVYSFFGKVSFSMAYGCLFGFFLLGAALIAIGMFISSLTDSQAVAAGACFVVMLFNYFISPLSNFLPASARYSYFGFALLFLLAGLFAYIMTRSLPAAAVFTIIIEGVLLYLYKVRSFNFLNLFPRTMAALSLFDRFKVYINGALDLKSVVYSLTVTAFFVFLTVQSFDKRRWS